MSITTHRSERSGWVRQPWLWFAIALALVAFGFWPSFLSALPNVPSHIFVHGTSATLWMALPIAQGLLIVKRRRSLHRRLGYASLALAAAVVVTGLHVVQTMILKNGDTVRFVSFKFALLDLTGIFLFVTFLAMAVQSARRHEIGMHLRLMACTALIPLEAANERTAIQLFPGIVPDFDAALYASLLSMEAICAALIVAEWWLDRVRWPFAFMLFYYLVMHIIATPVALDPQFQAFCQWYAHLGA
ncbi:hypothetical protein [Aquisediminimonas profunda]|uniref:hypothetical protein n=1 Tax=Aquisediminimonas profunda TaxID=1550733 RepID=UPI001C63998A|nr:hypothetical protein [Aquisediminimonas profunda]